ncbi:MAG: hypothetical protein ACP5SH_08005 [Syntrophobacteraceae bacterium]
MPDITEDAVRQQLRYILDSPEFRNKPMICGFLKHVVEETLAGRARDIKGYSIATRVFGRKEDFDPITDPIVRIQAARLRKFLESYYSGLGRQGQLRIEIGKGSYVPSFSKTTRDLQAPDSRKAEIQAGEDQTAPARSGLSLLPSADFPSIAVLPLVNLTDDKKIDYIAKGLTEELMSEFARCHGLRVTVSNCALCGRQEPGDAIEARREFAARFLLVGSIRKEKDTIKFTLRLIDSDTLTQIWGGQYKCGFEAGKIIPLQEDIARKTTGRVGGFFGAIAQKLAKESRSGPLPYFEACEVFVRFSQYLFDFSPKTHAKAMWALERVRLSDPVSALSSALQAFLHANEYAFIQPDNRKMIEQAVALARQAVSAEPENPMVGALLSYVLFVSGQRDCFFKEAEQTLLTHPALPDVVALLGWAIALYGEWDSGLALMEDAMRMNPYHPGWLHLAPYLNYFRQGNLEEACREAEKFNPPHLFWTPLVRIAALGHLGKGREAGSSVEALLRLRPDFPSLGRKITGAFIKDPDLACTFWEGLEKAGLKTF